ncbi:helix-turn-helix domain-containing protein [Terasakiella pusilla]|uniref:helix-turn-helix domain-containing protein n=1 Tax=Terasakiella pusilla TaxID=64973 RepID=UPI003AA9BDF5
MKEHQIIEPFLLRLKERIDSDPDITAASLSVKAGLSNAAIRHWLNGDSKSPTIESARKVCAALGTTLEEFMSEAQTEEEKEIVRLVLRLPSNLRQQLLAYGEGLAAASHQVQKEDN